MDDDVLAEALMRLAHARGADKTFCPSEAARAVTPEWRDVMDDVRRVASGLPLVATQKGRRVDPVAAKGPIRLALDPAAGGEA